MPDSDPSAHALDVPGARLYYERRGSGPLLLMIGSPMDSTGFAGLASAVASDYTVVTYDPRCIGNSSREDTSQDVTPDQQADDVHRLLSALGGGPAAVFGSSGGATVGLALVTAHPGQVHTLVAHEPPVVELLPDSAQVRAQFEDIYGTYLADGAEKAMQKFFAHAGLSGGTGAGGRRTAVGTLSGADGPHARHQRSLPRAFAPPDHVLPARHRGAEGGADADRGRRAGPRPRGSSRTARPWRSPTGSAPPRSTSPVTTSASWCSRSSSAASCTRCSPKRPAGSPEGRRE